LQQKIPKAVSFGFFIVIGVLVALTSWVFFVKRQVHDQDKLLEQAQALEVLTKAGVKLQKRWQLGDFERLSGQIKFNCPFELGELTNVGDQFLRCNPNYLQCFFSGKAGYKGEIEISLDKKKYFVLARPVFQSPSRYPDKKRFYQVISKTNSGMEITPDYGIQVVLSLKSMPEYSLPIILENTCHEVYLPERRYAHGEKTSKDFTWDNLNRNIYIDRFMVTFRDIAEWVDYSAEEIKIDIPKNRNQWSSPAYGLTSEQMQKYCGFRGKQVLTTTLYDAASFFPSDADKPWKKRVQRGMYPWSRLSKGEKLYQAWKRQNGNQLLDAETCHKAYVKGCEKFFEFPHYTNESTSWTGMNQLLGGPLEYLRNPIHPSFNLKASSFYFDAASPWHRLGIRTEWNGKDSYENSISWKNSKDKVYRPILDPDFQGYKIGFRCYREGRK